MDIQITEYGTWHVTTSTGQEFRLNERNGNLEVRVQEGGLIILPRSSNVTELAVSDW